MIRGNTQAFELIVETYQKPLNTYIRYIVYNQWDADDLVQEVFIKIFMKLNQYKPYSNFEGWIYKVAYNHTMNALKKKSKEQLTLTHQMIEPSSVDTSVLTEQVEQVLNQLTPEERAILFLRIHEDLSYKEISKIIHKTESSLRKKYERAKNRFITFYEEVNQDENRAI